ncbi:MAG: TIGR02757 family protein [Prevotella sp.]
MNISLPQATIDKLRLYADRYETRDFINGDPSWFMHQVKGRANQEAMAFVAQAISYGSRKQFMPKIQRLLDESGGEMARWIAEGAFNDIVPRDESCFYRLYNNDMFNRFLSAMRSMIREYGTIGDFIRQNSTDTLSAISALTTFFSNNDSNGIIPMNEKSSCKRLCMFMRWMVRHSSPVDLGHWSDFIDRRTLIMPMDVHVVRQSVNFGLLRSSTASMSSARRLTNTMLQVFPDDPLKGDFALFGLGVNESTT